MFHTIEQPFISYLGGWEVNMTYSSRYLLCHLEIVCSIDTGKVSQSSPRPPRHVIVTLPRKRNRYTCLAKGCISSRCLGLTLPNWTMHNVHVWSSFEHVTNVRLISTEVTPAYSYATSCPCHAVKITPAPYYILMSLPHVVLSEVYRYKVPCFVIVLPWKLWI